MARQVSHPNVCRVYDVGEFEGHTFLSMEYVDGEDLASLLRRIGRFPQDRAIELARQICAGPRRRARSRRRPSRSEAGEHHARRQRQDPDHRLRPRGRVRRERCAPARRPTWRPEQLAGGEVTPRSDIYALGLVLYELFTGQRALDAQQPGRADRQARAGGITPPTDIVRDLDPAIERVILRCLEADPARRPASALAVAAALPGGDPLAAALAAGETPSPEMVAAAGQTEALPRAIVIANRRVDRPLA